MTWAVVGLLTTYRKSRGLVLMLSIYVDNLLVTAVETPEPSKATRKNAVASAEHIFDQHGHKVVGVFESLPLAMSQAEKFGDAWEAGLPIAECPCEDIRTAVTMPAPPLGPVGDTEGYEG